MIIDLRTHSWTSLEQLGREPATHLREQRIEHWGQLDASPSAHEQATACVDASFVVGFASRLLGAAIPDEQLASIVRRDPTCLGVAGVDPMDPGALDHVERAVELGLSAIAVSPACQGFHPAHSQAMLVYERALERGMPVFVMAPVPYTASAQLEFARPSLWDEVARDLPELPILLGELGHPWIDETLVLLSKHPRMFAEISGVASRPWQLYTALQSARAQGVMDKLLFGSGFPYETPARVIEGLYGINAMTQGTPLPSIPRAQVSAIVERNAFACLGLEPPAEVGRGRDRHATGARASESRTGAPADA